MLLFVAYFFLHIPKTAGTSIRQIINDNFEFPKMCPSRAMLAQNNGLYNLPNEILNIPDNKFNNFDILRGHYHYSLAKKFNQPVKIFTFLRHPIDRCISHYKHIMRNMPAGTDINQLILSGEYKIMQNMQLRYVARDYNKNDDELSTLTNVDNCADLTPPLNLQDLEQAKYRLKNMVFVGIQEFFNESVAHLTAKFGWVCNNAPELNRSVNAKQKISDEAIEYLTNINALDIELYNFAVNLFETERKRVLTSYYLGQF